MRCDEIKAKLSEYVDGELSENEKNIVASHIRKCRDCKKEYEAYAALSIAVQDTQCTDLPTDFSVDIPKENKIRVLWRKYEKTVAVMVAAAALIIFANGMRNTPGLIVNEAPSPTQAITEFEFYAAPESSESADKKTDTAMPSAENDKAEKKENVTNKTEKLENVPSQSGAPLTEAPSGSAAQQNITLPAPNAEEWDENGAVQPASEPPQSKETVEPFKSEALAEDESPASSESFNSTVTASGYAGASDFDNYSGSAARSEATVNVSKSSLSLKSAVDLSLISNYSMPPSDAFKDSAAYESLKARLTSLKNRAETASDSEKQSILNEFDALRKEIDSSMK